MFWKRNKNEKDGETTSSETSKDDQIDDAIGDMISSLRKKLGDDVKVVPVRIPAGGDAMASLVKFLPREEQLRLLKMAQEKCVEAYLQAARATGTSGLAMMGGYMSDDGETPSEDEETGERMSVLSVFFIGTESNTKSLQESISMWADVRAATGDFTSTESDHDGEWDAL